MCAIQALFPTQRHREWYRVRPLYKIIKTTVFCDVVIRQGEVNEGFGCVYLCRASNVQGRKAAAMKTILPRSPPPVVIETERLSTLRLEKTIFTMVDAIHASQRYDPATPRKKHALAYRWLCDSSPTSANAFSFADEADEAERVVLWHADTVQSSRILVSDKVPDLQAPRRVCLQLIPPVGENRMLFGKARSCNAYHSRTSTQVEL